MYEIALITGCFAAVTLVIGSVSWFVIKGFRTFQDAAAKQLAELFEEYHVERPLAYESLVDIHFWSYHGFLNTLTTTRIDWRVKTEKALDCLRQLRKFNFQRGLFGAGALFVPFSTFYHYAKQKKRIIKKMEGDPHIL